ncbi:MAG: DUF7793 family protein [Bacteroidia bacterium]
MNIPNNVKRYEHPMATFWFDELGILYSISKTGPRTKQVMDEYINYVKNLINNKPVCILTDISRASPMDKETREYTAQKLQKVYKAMAIITSTPAGEMIGKVFLKLDGQPYPIAMFVNEKDAKEWLKQYL